MHLIHPSVGQQKRTSVKYVSLTTFLARDIYLFYLFIYLLKSLIIGLLLSGLFKFNWF